MVHGSIMVFLSTTETWFLLYIIGPVKLTDQKWHICKETAALDARKERLSESMRSRAKEGSVQRISPGMGEMVCKRVRKTGV